MGLDLITKSEYKAYAGLNSTNEDAKIDTLVPKISAFVKSYCKRTFIDYAEDAKVEVFSGGGKTLNLGEYPVLQVSSVEVSADYGQTYTALTEYVDYVVHQEGGYIEAINDSGFTQKLKAYKVTYTCGFEEIPPDLKLACFDLVTFYIKNDNAVHSMRPVGNSNTQIDYVRTGKLPSSISVILEDYMADWA
mgnify:CR=1 FL=1